MIHSWRREPHWVSNPHPDSEDDPPSEDDTLTRLQRHAQHPHAQHAPSRLHILDAIHAAFPALPYPVSRPRPAGRRSAGRCPGDALTFSTAEMRDPRAYRRRLRRELLRAPAQTVGRAEWLFSERGMGWREAVREALEERGRLGRAVEAWRRADEEQAALGEAVAVGRAGAARTVRFR